MSDTSPILSLPYILPSQAQKHVTHNEALDLLDVVVQAAVVSRGLTSPPSTLTVGDRHLVGTGATGAWAGEGNSIAVWGGDAQGWRFVSPKMGWRVYVQESGVEVVWTGSAWQSLGSGGDTSSVEMLGIATTADSTNRLAVSAPATLLTHAGAGHQLKINKATQAATGSLLFQTNWSGRAEMGLAGSDNFEIKVSADGSTFQSALRAAATTGTVTFDNGAVINGAVTGTGVQASTSDATAGRLLRVGAFGIGGAAPLVANIGLTDSTIAPGLYAYDVALGSSGGPTGAQAGILLHQRRGAGQEVQLLVVEASTASAAPVGAIFSRARTGGAWGGWISGAAIETVSTTQGRYERSQNGNQTCWQKVTTLTTGEAAVTFPAAFASTTDLITTLGVNSSATTAIIPRITGRTATGLSVSAFNTSNARVAAEIEIVTIGRWY